MQITPKKRYLAQATALSLAMNLISACGMNLSTLQNNGGNSGDTGSTNSIQGKDFGDAPDQITDSDGLLGKFPTRLSSKGAHHLNLNDSALGFLQKNGLLPVSAEEDAADPADTDGVMNLDDPSFAYDLDHFDDGLALTNLNGNGTSNLDVIVTVAAGAPKQVRYLNILIDYNHDGEWKGTDMNGASEWAVQNHEVTVKPGESAQITTPDFFTGLYPENSWMRITLSDTPIASSLYPDGWDGTGEFAKGETEDYYYNNTDTFNITQDPPASPFPTPSVPPPPPPPGGGGGGGGGNGGGGNKCEYNKSYTWEVCEGKSKTRLLTIDGFAPDSISVSSNNPDVASVGKDEANITITGNGEGSTSINIVAKQGGCTYYITVYVKVKKCPKPAKVKKDCCTPAEIRMDPSLCKNCKVVGWTIHTNETPGGGGSSADGSIGLTGSHGETTGISKSTVVVVGNVIKIVTTYYKCDPCPEAALADDGDGDNDGICDARDPYADEYNDPDQAQNFYEQLYLFELLGEEQQGDLFYEIRDYSAFQSEYENYENNGYNQNDYAELY